MYESDDNETAIAHIPLKNLPDCGIKGFMNDPWTEGDPVRPNNVLIGLIDQTDRVSVVGRDNETGQLVFASSEENPRKVIRDLREFIEFLEVYDEQQNG